MNDINLDDLDNLLQEQESPVSPTARALVDATKQLDALNESIKPQVDRVNEINATIANIREAMQLQIDELSKERNVLETDIWDTRKQIRSLNAEIASLKRKLEQELENERVKEEFQSNAVIFSKRIAQYSYMDKILPHQKDGAFVLATSGRAILGDKRGLGKTLTSIATLDALQVQKVLIFVPDDVLSNFVNEVNFWAPHRTVFPVGKMPKAQREFALAMAKQLDQYVIVCNYSAWRKDKSLLDSFIDLRLECVIADEAHELKNTTTSAYKGVHKVVMAENCCPMCSSETSKDNRDIYNRSFDKCMRCDWQSNNTHDFEWDFLDRKSVKHVFPMTGTVILNKPQDLYAQLSLVDPVNFRSEHNYLRDYCMQDMYTNKWRFKPGGLESLKNKLSGKFLARDDKSAGVVRPKQSILIHDVELDPEQYPGQYRVIEQLSKHAQIIMEASKAKMNILATIALITRKRQANVWPAGIRLKNEEGDVVFSVGDEVKESVKLDKIITTDGSEGLIPEFTEDGDKQLGARVAVFSQFKGPLEELERRCRNAGISVVRFDGDTPDAVAEEAKRDFDRRYADQEGYNYKWQVILANYRKGGVGLNFTSVTETIILDEEWNPGKQEQAYGRTDRIGQTQENNIHIIRIPRTIDSWMVALNEEKANLIQGFEATTGNLADNLLDALKNGDIL